MEWTYLFFWLLSTNVFIHVSALGIPIERAGVVKRAATGASIKSVSFATAGNNSNLGSIQDTRVNSHSIVFLAHIVLTNSQYTTTIKVNEVGT
jgi:hypothetical protein